MGGPCARCHLEGIHRGRIKVEPPAPGVRWWIGERPIMKVEGPTMTPLSYV